jgi:glyoxylase-like metal-dependent hydrolase (beta-lactamase superfamily II)
MTDSYPFNVGSLSCAAISAGAGRFRVQAFFADVPPETLTPVLERHGIRSDKIDTPLNCLLIHHPDALVLIDTGTKAARLVQSLSQHGIAPQDIDLVILSHAHPDHTGGALDQQGRPAFPNARYVLPAAEPTAARQRLASLPLELIDPETELLTGIHTFAVPGHTLGQIAVKIEANGEILIYTADVIAHPIHVEQPGWNIISDADRAQAISTRAALLAQAASDNWRLFVYHFPFPGLCRIARSENDWRITEQTAL